MAIFGKQAAYQALCLAAAAWAVTVIPEKYNKEAGTALGLISSLGALLVCAKYQAPVNERGMFCGNPSMMGCLIAALLPMCPAPIIPIAIIAIFLTESSVSLGVLVVTVGAWALAKRPKLVPYSVLAGAGVLSIGWKQQGPALFVDSGRFDLWGLVYRNWDATANQWFGWGPGTVFVKVPALQQKVNPHVTELFLWLHNDWLQILVESGYFGLISALIVYSRVLWKSWDRPEVFAALCGFGVMGVFNYPLRLPVHALCVVMLVFLAEKKERAPVKQQTEQDCFSSTTTPWISQSQRLQACIDLSKSYMPLPARFSFARSLQSLCRRLRRVFR
jgi:hypothetical protein